MASSLIGLIASILAAASAFALRGSEWYGGLQLPVPVPPLPWIAVSWCLSLMLGSASAIAVLRIDERRGAVLSLHAASGILVLLWLHLFYRVHQMPLSLLSLVAAAGLLGLASRQIWPESKRALLFLGPVFLWTIACGLLTLAAWYSLSA